jgi:hypothetical protein
MAKQPQYGSFYKENHDMLQTRKNLLKLFKNPLTNREVFVIIP